jgi:hypothetical protein
MGFDDLDPSLGKCGGRPSHRVGKCTGFGPPRPMAMWRERIRPGPFGQPDCGRSVDLRQVCRRPAHGRRGSRRVQQPQDRHPAPSQLLGRLDHDGDIGPPGSRHLERRQRSDDVSTIGEVEGDVAGHVDSFDHEAMRLSWHCFQSRSCARSTVPRGRYRRDELSDVMTPAVGHPVERVRRFTPRRQASSPSDSRRKAPVLLVQPKRVQRPPSARRGP